MVADRDLWKNCPAYLASMERGGLQVKVGVTPGHRGDRVTVKRLAEALQMDRSACRKYVLRLGYKPQKLRTSGSGYQTAITLSHAEALEVWRARRADGYVSGDPPSLLS